MSADVHALSGAYAVDAVGPVERAAFEAHLDQCASCRLEVVTLHVAAAHLSSAVTARPPPRLGQRTISVAARMPQVSASLAPLTRKPRGRWIRQLTRLATTLAVLASVLIMAAPVSAHTTLLDTDPDAGAVLAAPPAEVQLTFNQPVQLTAGGIQLSDATSRNLATSGRSEGSVVRVDLPPGLGDGRYVISWRVVSADGHPLSGALSFAVRQPSDPVAVPNSSSPVPDASSPDSAPANERVRSLVQGLHYGALLLATGLVGFGFMLPRAVPAALRRRLGRVSAVATAGAVLTGFALVPLSGAIKLGGSLATMSSAAAWDPRLVGTEWLAALLVASALGVLVTTRAATSRVQGQGRHAVPIVGAICALAAPSLVGHTRSVGTEPLLMLTDLIHLVAGAIWFGGLVGLVMILPALRTDRGLAARVLSRFSIAAAASLAVLVALGSVLSWRILGSWHQLSHTSYGTLLLVKVAIVAVAVLVALANRFVLLPRVRRSDADGATRSGIRLIRRAIAVEAILLAGALLTTGFLANQSPHRDESSVATPDLADN